MTTTTIEPPTTTCRPPRAAVRRRPPRRIARTAEDAPVPGTRGAADGDRLSRIGRILARALHRIAEQEGAAQA